MCELLGMDCNTPTDIVFSFRGFACRGGRTGAHADGWGLAFFEGRAARVFLEPRACAQSPLARFLSENPIHTLQAVSHIRKRTRGEVTLSNTHPFVRELWGRSWVFAHNGNVKRPSTLSLGRFTPIGRTDSERAFCHLLERVRRRFKRYPDDPQALWRYVAKVSGEIAELGSFNFVLGNGRELMARCDTKLWYVVRAAPFGRATLKDEEVTVDFSAVTQPRDRVAVIATMPLTVDEAWTQCEPATLTVFRKGKVVAVLPSGRPIARSVADPSVADALKAG